MKSVFKLMEIKYVLSEWIWNSYKWIWNSIRSKSK